MRRRKKEPPPLQAVGVAWYRREDYALLKAMFPDGGRLPDAFDDWLQNAEQVRDHLAGEGIKVIQAHIRRDAFPEWCRARGLKPDAKARMRYASEYAAKRSNLSPAIDPTRRDPA